MPKGTSGGKRSTIAAGGGITLNLQSYGFGGAQTITDTGLPENATVSQVEQGIMSQNAESVAVFGNDRRLITVEHGDGGEVTLSGATLSRYRNDIRVMTHNHPVDLSLSTGDLFAASKLGTETQQNFEELRAISKDGNVYRAVRPKSGKWPTEADIQTAINSNIKTSYERALQARKRGSSREDAFQLYQEDLTNRVAKDTGIQLRGGKQEKNPLQLFNASVLPEMPETLRTPSGRPTQIARESYGFQTGTTGERVGAFPIFDVQSAMAAIQLRGRARTEEGRRDILERARQYAPESAEKAFQRDLQLQGISLTNVSNELQMRNPKTGKPTAEARQMYGANLPGEKAGSFPIWDEQSARAALHLRRHIRTEQGRERVFREASKYVPDQAEQARQRDRGEDIALQNMTQQYRSLVSGKPNAAARREFGFRDTQGERQGAFPIFDVQSAQAALRLRGHTQTIEGRRNVIERARQYAPGEAEQALARDVRRGVVSDGIRLQNYSGGYNPYQTRYQNNLVGVTQATGTAAGLAAQGIGRQMSGVNRSIQRNRQRQQVRETITPPEPRGGESKLLGVAGAYFGIKYAGKAADIVTPGKGPLRIITGPAKMLAMYYGMKEGYKAGKGSPGTISNLAEGVKTGRINTETIRKNANPKDLSRYGKDILQSASVRSKKGMSSTSFYLKSGINPLSAISREQKTKAAFWAVNPYTRKIPAYALGIGAGRIAFEVLKGSGGPVTAIVGAGVAGFGGKLVGEMVAHNVSKNIASRYSPTPMSIFGDSNAYVASRTAFGGLRGGAYAGREVMLQRHTEAQQRKREASKERKVRKQVQEAKQLLQREIPQYNQNTVLGRMRQQRAYAQRASARALLEQTEG